MTKTEELERAEQARAEETLLEIRRQIADLSEARRLRILSIKISIDNILRAGGDDARMALALVGAEEAAKEE